MEMATLGFVWEPYRHPGPGGQPDSPGSQGWEKTVQDMNISTHLPPQIP